MSHEIPEDQTNAAPLNYYDKMAAQYDSLAEAGPDLRPYIRDALTALDLSPRRVLDLGAGTGRISAVVAQLYPAAQLDLVDGSSAMLERAKLPDATTHVSDIDAFLDTSDDSYDLVVSVSVFELLPDLPATLGRIARRLPTDGHVVFTYEPLLAEHATQSHRTHEVQLDGAPLRVTRWSEEEVAHALETASLRVESNQRIPGIQHIQEPGVYQLIAASRQ